MKEKKSTGEKGKNLMCLSLLFLMFFPMSARADTVTVTNSVTSHASSGGNVSTGGAVIEGKTTNSVSVKTVINGEVVEDYSKTSDTPIHYEQTVMKGESTSTTIIDTSVGNTVVADAPTPTVSRAIHQEEVISKNATHNRAPEIPMQSGEVSSSTEGIDTHVSAAATPIAAGVKAEARVATRMIMNIKSLFIHIINFLSW